MKKIIIAILLLLFAGSFLPMMQMRADIKRNKTEAQMSGMAAGIEMFFRDKGRYPTANEFDQMADMGYWHNDYYKDHVWGHPFIYEPQDGQSFNLHWLGRDGKVGGSGSDSEFTIKSGRP